MDRDALQGNGATSDVTLRPGYVPGAIGRITELHGSYYSQYWGFGLFFESKVAVELSEFLRHFDSAHDGFWVATAGKEIVGAIAIDGAQADERGARLRWFIVAPEYQGRGLGHALLDQAIDFCKRARLKRVYLTTFAGLDAARHLYEKSGFALCEEQEDDHWGKTVIEQTFELVLA
jgi:ribosomal protein S18 acetylase RimI-like enzyme